MSERTRVLFVCSQNRLRSPTAEAVFSDRPDLEVRSAGTDPGAKVLVTAKLLGWADLVLCMEDEHKRRVLKVKRPWGSAPLRVQVLRVPDEFLCMDAELVALLRRRAAPWLGGGA